MKDYKILLEKFWAGNASEIEKLQLYKLIAEEDKNIKTSLNNDKYISLLQHEESQKILDALHKKLGIVSEKNETTKIKFMTALGWSVSVAAVLAIAILVFKPTGTRPTDKQISKPSVMTDERTIENNTSRMMTVRLPDSSVVGIYPNSNIRFQNNFNNLNARTVHLKGRASFKVKHNANKPFEVVAMQIKTTDLGTEFCINALHPDDLRINLKKGSIKVEALPGSELNMPSTILKPGQEIKINIAENRVQTFDSAETVTHQKENSETKHIQHAKERLTFDSAPLADVFNKLAKREQTEITFNKSDMEGLTFTGNIEPNDPLDVSLNILCNLNGLSYKKTQKGIEVSKSK